MFTTETVPCEAAAQHLDHLSGELISALLRVEPRDTGRIVDRMLEQIGETLASDRISFEVFSDLDDTVHRGPRVWTRPGSLVTREGARTISVFTAGRRIGALTVVPGDRGCDPASFERRLTMMAELLALAERGLAQVNGPGQKSPEAHELPRTRIFGDRDQETEDADDFEEIVGESPALRVAFRRVLEVAPTDASVVLIGETGTGKELFARAVHRRSDRRGHPFICVNCAALPPTLIESELFGHERGAFTGALSTRRGRFELAHKGTLFLDEIGDLPADVQAKLLRVLQEGEFERVGSSEPRKVDVRIVAATHHDLDRAVKEGRFRPDLYYRLNVFPIALPPLRDRKEDIPRLVWFFINQHQRALNRRITSIPPPVLASLLQHSWPGNVRELQNVIERAMIHSTGSTLLLDDGPAVPGWSGASTGETLEAVERGHIEAVLRRCRWRINGAGNAADVLGLHPNTLRFRMKKLGLHRPKEQSVVIDVGRLSA